MRINKSPLHQTEWNDTRPRDMSTYPSLIRLDPLFSSVQRVFFFSLSLVTVLAMDVGTVQSHENHKHAEEAQDGGDISIAKGVVFDDLNRNGQYDKGEMGLAGMKVSNGREIVVTGADGGYELPVSDDCILFVIKPRDWATPLDENQLPRFYYIHKPKGSPEGTRFAGVAPTGELPESINFPLHRQKEPEQFKALLFGDPQPRNMAEVEYIQHDVIEQIVMEEGHDASFGVTLGDIVFDDLSLMKPLSQAIALIGIPWYNVIGNHDMNTDAPNDKLSDETFERLYGPSYYSFDYGPAHFLILDDVVWEGPKDGKKGHYHAGLGTRQVEFIKNDLAAIPKDQLVVLMMHIPLGGMQDRQDLFRLIEQRPATVSISAHTHTMGHRYFGKEDGWRGAEPHHHIVNVTVGGSWWRGQKDERGIPHATMTDGGPNGYSIMEFDGNEYSLVFRAAGRPAHYQMSIFSDEAVKVDELDGKNVSVNVFNGSIKTKVHMKIGDQSDWLPMKQITAADPYFRRVKEREDSIEKKDWIALPGPGRTSHQWSAELPTELPAGTHLIQVKAVTGGQTVTGKRIIRILPE